MANLYCTPIVDNIGKFDCGMKRGGLKGVIYAANFGEILDISSTTSDKNIDTITMQTNPLTSAPFYWFSIVFKKNSAGLSNELQIGNNKFVNQTITFSVEGITATSLAVLEAMADGEAVFIATDYQGVTHILGRIAGLEVSATAYGTGTAQDDLYGGTITFSSAEPEYSNIVVQGTQIEIWNGASTDTITL